MQLLKGELSHRSSDSFEVSDSISPSPCPKYGIRESEMPKRGGVKTTPRLPSETGRGEDTTENTTTKPLCLSSERTMFKVIYSSVWDPLELL